MLVQRHLSARLCYRSVYEAQVGNRGESPAHHTQHLEIALRILREQQVTHLDDVGNLDLVSLLRSGVPVDLGDGRRLFVGILRPASAFAHTSIAESGRELAGTGTNIIAILRGEHMRAPRADMVLEPDDRLLLVTGSDALDELRAYSEPW